MIKIGFSKKTSLANSSKHFAISLVAGEGFNYFMLYSKQTKKLNNSRWTGLLAAMKENKTLFKFTIEQLKEETDCWVDNLGSLGSRISGRRRLLIRGYGVMARRLSSLVKL